MTKETRFQQSCPRKLSKYPTKPCPLALQSMEAVRNGQPELAACLLPGSLVKTINGWTKIEDVVEGTLVWTHKGRWRKVEKVTVNEYSGNVIRFKNLHTFGTSPWFTYGHRILTAMLSSDRKYAFTGWVKSEDLTEEGKGRDRDKRKTRMYLCIPKNKEEAFEPDLGPLKKLGKLGYWLIGYWLAEGSIIWNAKKEPIGLSFSMHVKELESFGKKVNELAKILGIKTRHYKKKHTLAAYVAFNNREVAEWILNNFKHLCNKKEIPKQFWNLSLENGEQLFNGIYDGDGTKVSEKNFIIEMTSKSVVSWMQHFLIQKGLCRPIIRVRKVDSRKKISYVIAWSRQEVNKIKHQDSDYFYTAIKSKEEKIYTGPVYDLTINEDQSFDVGFSVHNCPYFINNLENNFCFFQYMEEDCPNEGVESNRKIGQQLLLSEKEVTGALTSALEKLKDCGEDINLFAEAVNEKHDYYQEDIYSGEMWITEVTGKDLEELSIESLEPGRPGRKKKIVIQTPKGHSGAGAVHKDGKKIQLHSLSKNWNEHVKEFQKGATPIRIANNTLGKKEKKKDKEDEESKKDS